MNVNASFPGVMTTGVNGMYTALNGLQKTAHEIAGLNRSEDSPSADSQPRDLDSLVKSMTDLKIYRRDLEASARVVETADAMVGFLLDVRA